MEKGTKEEMENMLPSDCSASHIVIRLVMIPWTRATAGFLLASRPQRTAHIQCRTSDNDENNESLDIHTKKVVSSQHSVEKRL